MSRKVWTVLAGMILSGTAHAAIISTGTLYAPDSVECDVMNIGTKPVTVKSVTIIDASGAVHNPTSTNCMFPGPISPQLGCIITAGATSVGYGHYMRCVIDTSSKSSIRATMVYFLSTINGGTVVLEAH